MTQIEDYGLRPIGRKPLSPVGLPGPAVGENYTRHVLVLSRSVGETIVIGNNVRVTVVQVKGDQVRIGIEAPREVPVHRLEVFEELRRANQAAASPTPADLDLVRRPDQN